MNTPNESTKLSPAEEIPHPKVGRRRFLGAGSAAAPVVMTLLSQPALGAAVDCFTPSRSLSRNTSITQDGKYGLCDGESPGNYMAQSDPNNTHGNSYHWPASTPPTTPFHSIFSGELHFIEVEIENPVTRIKSMQTRSRTMLEVMQLNGVGDESQIGFHMIGALLNIRRGLIPENVLNESKLLGMWTEWRTTNGYLPFAGVTPWNAQQIVTYLKSNKIAP